MTVGAVFNRACMDCARGFLFPPRAFFLCLNQDGQDEQDGQDRTSQECGEKVHRTLMSIERRRNTQKRSIGP